MFSTAGRLGQGKYNTFLIPIYPDIVHLDVNALKQEVYQLEEFSQKLFMELEELYIEMVSC
jgi:hypothetical protein